MFTDVMPQSGESIINIEIYRVITLIRLTNSNICLFLKKI